MPMTILYFCVVICMKILPMVVILLSTVIQLVYLCPGSCTCTGTNIGCISLKLVDIPDLSGSTDATVLYLNDNQLTSLSAEAFKNMTVLENLTLYDNHLTSITETTFHGLISLYLHKNQLTTIVETTFSGLKSLKVLTLYDNHLTSITETTFHGLDSLNQLQLHMNQLTTIVETTFSGLKSLEYLTLHDNHLTSITETTFHGLDSLNRLQLHMNQLTTIVETTFSGLKSLEYLTLNDNHLTSITETTFHGLDSLKYLYIDDNELTTIVERTFNSLKGLITLTLFGNPFDCQNCRAESLQVFLLNSTLNTRAKCNMMTTSVKYYDFSNCTETDQNHGESLTSKERSSYIHPGLVAGVTVGVVVFLIFLSAIIVICVKKINRSKIREIKNLSR